LGTPESVSLLRRQLDVLDAPPTVVGAVYARPPSLGPCETPVLDLGPEADLESIAQAHAIRLAIVSLPAGLAGVEASWRQRLARAGVRVRVVPPLTELLAREPARAVSRTADAIDLATLVARDPHPVDRDQLTRLLRGARVLITGAGGSIGSEIARLCASFEPAQLVLVDRSENALFEIDRSLGRSRSKVSRSAILHDVVDERATARLVAQTRPDLIFHAAAHKHVPLMEDHPAHALVNNFFGTRSIVDAAIESGVDRFVLISSDKAVNPTSIMGATKRLAEMYLQGLARARGEHMRTRLSMVRFGNVLGSACSVLPIWESQIAEGGPVTVTDERMTRYFMTIPEAAGLVVHAASLSHDQDAEVFVLDMGRPIAILDLARRFIEAHGLRAVPSTHASSARAWDEIEITMTGARPGEKLHEELAYLEEGLARTSHPGILALADARAPDPATLAAMVEHLSMARRIGESRDVVAAIARFIPQLARARAAA
jgi:FlaA1/EpsC-like NDP-sugar epimerase